MIKKVYKWQYRQGDDICVAVCVVLMVGVWFI
jgi:hypothetical protein